MTNLEVVAVIAVALWLLVLTIIILLTVRQVALIALRISRSGGSPVLDRDGPAVDSAVPADVASLVPGLLQGGKVLLLMSSSCTTCRELAVELTTEKEAGLADVVVLVAGAEDIATQMLELLPPHLTVIQDPTATNIANALSITSAPFAVRVESGKVTAKHYIYAVEDFRNLLNREADQVEAEALVGQVVTGRQQA